jgi:hypothetical protein
MELFQSGSQHAGSMPASNASAASFTAFDVSKVNLAGAALSEVPYYEAVESLMRKPSSFGYSPDTMPTKPTPL